MSKKELRKQLSRFLIHRDYAEIEDFIAQIIIRKSAELDSFSFELESSSSTDSSSSEKEFFSEPISLDTDFEHSAESTLSPISHGVTEILDSSEETIKELEKEIKSLERRKRDK